LFLWLIIKIVYEKETGKTDENGKPLTDELDFISRKDGVLMLTASLETLKEASSSFQGYGCERSAIHRKSK